MRVEKVPLLKVRGGAARAKVNHDNPVSGNHPGSVTLNTQWNVENLPILTAEKGGTRTKLFSATVHDGHVLRKALEFEVRGKRK